MFLSKSFRTVAKQYFWTQQFGLSVSVITYKTVTQFEYMTIIIEKDEEAWKFFPWRKHLSSSLFTLLPFLVHQLIDRGVSCSRLRSAQGLWSAAWFRHSIASPPGVTFSSTILLYRASPPKLVCPCRVPSHSSFSSRTIGFKSVHEMALYEIFFQWKGFVTDLQLPALIWLGVSPPGFDNGAHMKYSLVPNSAIFFT